MYKPIKIDLMEHIDGLNTTLPNKKDMEPNKADWIYILGSPDQVLDGLDQGFLKLVITKGW